MKSINFSKNASQKLNKILIISSVGLLFFQFQYWEGSSWAIAAFFIFFGLLFSFLALYFIITGSNADFIFSVVFATIAAFTAGNGLIVFPVAALLIYIRNGFSKTFFIWLVTGILIFFSYFWKYITPADQTPIIKTLSEKPLKVMLFFLSYLGANFKQVPSYGNVLSTIAGIIFILILIYLFNKKYYNINPLISGIILFLFLTMAANSIARVDGGFIPRYNIFSTIFLICISIAIIEIFSGKIKVVHLILFFSFCVIFNIYSFLVNFNYIKKMNYTITEGAILAKAGDYSLLIYPDSSNVRKLLQAGEQKNIYHIPDFSYGDVTASDISIQGKKETGDIENEYNNFQNTEDYLYINGWINTKNKLLNKNTKIYIILKSDNNTFIFNTYPMRRKELKENNMSRTEELSYSFVLLKKDMKLPSGNYTIGFYIESEGQYHLLLTDDNYKL